MFPGQTTSGRTVNLHGGSISTYLKMDRNSGVEYPADTGKVVGANPTGPTPN